MQKPIIQLDDQTITIVIRFEVAGAATGAQPPAGDVIMTPAEAAYYLRISKAKMYSMLKRGQVPAIKIGKSIRIRRSALEAWLSDQT